MNRMPKLLPRFALILASVLLLAAGSALAQNGPVFGIWPVDGHGYAWQQEQLDADLPLEPCVRMGNAYELRRETFRFLGEADAEFLSALNGRGVVLRMDNITTELDHTFSRFPITEGNWQESFLSIRRLKDGRLDDTPIPSPFAGTIAWEEAGKVWATSPWMRRLQEILPDPASVILRENSEGAILPFGSLYISQHVRVRNHNDALVFVSLKDWEAGKYERDQLLDLAGVPLLPSDFVGRGRDANLFFFRWKTDEQLDRIDLRAKHWVFDHRHLRPDDARKDFEALYRRQFRALADAFNEHLSDGWRQESLRTCGYGDFHENRHHNAASLFTYMGIYRPVSLTDPHHAREIDARRAEWAANQSPWSWRELSIRHRQPTMFKPAQEGQHDVVDAESFAGYMLHNAWAMQSPGREVRLVWYEDYQTPADQLIVDSPAWQDVAVELGREDLLELTIGDCEVAVMERLREIHEHPTLRRYWQQGTTEIAGSADNSASEHRVYAMLTSIPDEPRKLLCVYTPCSVEQLPTIQAAGIKLLPWARSDYYLTNPLERLPEPTPEPLTLEQRVERLEREVFGE